MFFKHILRIYTSVYPEITCLNMSLKHEVHTTNVAKRIPESNTSVIHVF